MKRLPPTLRLGLYASLGASLSGVGQALACPYCRVGVASVVGTYDQPIPTYRPAPAKKATPATQPCTAVKPTTTAARLASAPVAMSTNPLPPVGPALPWGFSLSGGSDLTTAYYHRGYLMGNRGAIVQPYFNIARPWVVNGGFSITPYVGTWMDFQEGGTRTNPSHNGTAISDAGTATMFCCATAAPVKTKSNALWITPPDVPRAPGAGPVLPGGGGPGGSSTGASSSAAVHTRAAGGDSSGFDLYEADITGGAAINAGPLFLDLKYTDYTYPDGALQGYQEVGAKASVDLIQLIHEQPSSFLLRPYVEVERETAGVGKTQFTYIEAGIEPAVAVPIGRTRMGLSVPVEFGLSGAGFYQNANGSNAVLGFNSVGLKASLPLSLPRRDGQWFVTGSVTYLHLDASNIRILNDGHSDEAIGALGLSFRF